MIKRFIALILACGMAFALCGCTQATVVSENISKEADNFNVIRRITVINMRSDKPIFELIAAFSLQNSASNELLLICQTGQNEYKKHFIYLNQWTMYVVEDVSGSSVSPYRYEVNFLPEMILPVTVTQSY